MSWPAEEARRAELRSEGRARLLLLEDGVAPPPGIDDLEDWIRMPAGDLDVEARAGWPSGAPGRNALDVHVLRLRRRLVPLALAIRTVRSRGYLLESAPSGGG